MSKNFYPWLRIFETLFVRLSLFHLSSALLPLILAGGANEGDGVDANSIDFSLLAKVNLIIYFFTVILLVLRWKKVLSLASKDLLLWSFVAFFSFSYFWSSMPEVTGKRAVYAIGTTLFGLYLASRYSIQEQIKHLAWTLGFILFLSAVFVVALPSYGVMGGIHEGAIRGIFVHKNVFSPVIVLSVVIFFLQALDAKDNKWLLWGLFALSIAFSIMSRSSTALVLTIIMLFLCFCYRIFRWRYEVLISSLLLIFIIGFAATIWFVDFGGADFLFGTLGKDPTLSRRTEIWAYVWDSIQKKPLFGYGLGGYWNGVDGPSAYVLNAMRVNVHYAHNGFLEILLGLGFIGFFLFLAKFLVVTSQSIALLRNSNTVASFWPLILLTYIIFTNLTEGNLGTFNTISWALFTAAAFSLISLRTNKLSI